MVENGNLKKVKSSWKVNVFGQDRKIMVRIGQVVVVEDVLAEIVMKDEVLVSAEVLAGLGKQELADLRKNLTGRVVEAGEVIYHKSGWQGTTPIIAPVDGTIILIDEFNNIHIEGKSSWKKTVTTPVGGKVVDIDEDGIELEFTAWEVWGKGVGESKVWGNWDALVKDDWKQLDTGCRAAIVVANRVDHIFVTKALVLGVVGIISGETEPDLKGVIPMVEIDSQTILSMVAKAKMGRITKILLDSSNGQILIVVQ